MAVAMFGPLFFNKPAKACEAVSKLGCLATKFTRKFLLPAFVDMGAALRLVKAVGVNPDIDILLPAWYSPYHCSAAFLHRTQTIDWRFSRPENNLALLGS